jgi:acyl carrier protein phosphodiesterase
MNNKEVYVIEKERRISGIKNMLTIRDLTDNQRYTIYNKLYDEYYPYKVDSAIYYQELNLKLAGKYNHLEHKYTTLLNLSFSYWIKGRFFESMHIMDNLDRKLFDRLPEWLLFEYYEAYERLYMYYASTEGNNVNQYYRQSNLYRDSLLQLVQPNMLKYNILTAEKQRDENNTGEAKKLLIKSLENIKSENHDKAIVANILANIYKKEGNVEMQKKYYAISAICDIKNAVKENTSMMALALLLYSEGSIDEAYKCIKFSMDDAVFCNAYFRTYELSKIFPIIDSAYQEKTEKQKSELQKYLLLVSVLSVFLIFAMIYVYRQMKRIAKIRKELHQTNVKLNILNTDLQQSNTKLQELNGQLSTINQRLTETNRVKEAYLGKFIDLCSSYIEKLDNYRRSLNKIANSGKIEELLRSLKSSQFIEDELSDFYTNFDETFLRIYPTFITDFNSLFPEEEKQVSKQGELLNTELRICALIRLGINDSAQIAVFLRYSITTIYTYRSKLKNKSLYPENFEERIMRIGSY